MKLPCLTGLAIRYIHYTVLEIQHSTNALYYYNNLHFYQYGYKVHGGFSNWFDIIIWDVP